MQKLRPKTLTAEIADHFLRILLASGAGIAWFVFLWGLSLPALCAGLALGAMLWLCARQFSKSATQKREVQMRRMIGGELALDRLLLEQPRKAAFQCALWLAPRYPLVMQNVVDWSVIGTLNERKTCIRLIARHKSQQINAQQIVECAREARKRSLDQTLLCLTAPVSSEALSYAAALDPPMRIIRREELMELAGYAHPATDEDLRLIGRQKKTRRSAQEWLAVVLDASRARTYFWYAAGLWMFALLTGSRYYPFPAAACSLLYAACKFRQMFFSSRRWKA